MEYIPLLAYKCGSILRPWNNFICKYENFAQKHSILNLIMSHSPLVIVVWSHRTTH